MIATAEVFSPSEVQALNTAVMPSRTQPTRELATVLFTDIVDSTTQLAASGDQVWARVLDALDAVTRSEVRRRGGEFIKHTGDGALMLLPSPSSAVDCAGALHAGAEQLGVALRIGAHTGEVERRGQDVAGIAVHVAARLMASAGAEETLVSGTVHALATRSQCLFEDRGELDLKGIPEPVPAYAIRQSTPSRPAPAPAVSEVGSVTRLLDQLRFEEAADLAADIDPVALVEALVAAGGRIEFLDVDVTLVRMLRDLLARLPEDAAVGRARTAAKLAFELRGDPASAEERRRLLDLAIELAEAARDDIAISDVLLATIHALWEPEGVPDRLTAAERVIALTRITHQVDHELEARLARVHALVELWQVHEAGLELASYARLAARLERPDVNVYVASRRAMLAQISGRYDEQVRQGEIAYQNAKQARMPDADRLRLAHRWPVSRDCETGNETLEVGLAMLRQLAELMPGNYYELDVAAALLDSGRTSEAKVELVRGLPPLFTSTGYRWLAAATNAARVAAAVGSEQECRRLYDALLPHEDRLVVIGPNFLGPVGDHLGVLELRLGRVDAAIARLRRTVTALDEIAALPWSARSRAHLAEALRAAGDGEGADRELATALDLARSLGMDRFVSEIHAAPTATSGAVWSLKRDGDDWLVATGSEQARLRPNRGLEHLAVLLANPHRDVASTHLDAGMEIVPMDAELPRLDEQALAEYQRRLREIDAEREVADRTGDQPAAERLEEEREFLLAEVRRVTGLGGRRRTAGGAAERARVNVTRNLKRAIEQIQRTAPIAGAHLAASIRTGLHCRYEPAPGGPSSWQIDTRG